MGLTKKQALAVLGLMLALMGCGTQVDGDYDGEVVGVVQGQLTIHPDVDVPRDLKLAIAWAKNTGEDATLSQSVNVSSNFPQGFLLELKEPPPEAILNDYSLGGALTDERPVALGFVMAYPASLEALLPEVLTGTTKFPKGTVVGISPDYVVAYVKKDLVEGSYAAELVGGPLRKGFHLLKATPSGATQEESDAFFACQDDAVTACGAADPMGDDEAIREALRCEAAKQKELGCFGPPPFFDRLAEPDNGFDSEVSVVVGDAEDDSLGGPNWM